MIIAIVCFAGIGKINAGFRAQARTTGKSAKMAEPSMAAKALFAGGCFWRRINPTDAGGQFVDRGHEFILAALRFIPVQKPAESGYGEYGKLFK